MNRNHVRYLLVLLGALVFFLCFNGYLSSYILICTLLFPIVSFLASLPGMLSIRLGLSVGAFSVRKGQEAPLRLQISSRFPLASGRAQVTLAVHNTLTDETAEEQLYFTACRGTQAVGHHLTFSSCGKVVCRLTRGLAWDYLGLIPLPLRLPEPVSVLFYPAPVDVYLTAETVAISGGEGDSYSQTKAGDDPSELFGLREYREGDKLSRVHWKLSQKTGQTLVKEFGLPITDHFFFLIEPNGSGLEDDALMDVFVTLSSFLSEQGAAHRAGFRDNSGQRLHLMEITGPEDARLVLGALLTAGYWQDLTGLDDQELPAGVTHALYLTCSPKNSIVSLLQTRMPSARLSVLHISEDPDAAKPSLPPEAEYTLLLTDSLAEGLNGFYL